MTQPLRKERDSYDYKRSVANHFKQTHLIEIELKRRGELSRIKMFNLHLKNNKIYYLNLLFVLYHIPYIIMFLSSISIVLYSLFFMTSDKDILFSFTFLYKRFV